MENNWFIKLSIKHFWLWYVSTFPAILILLFVAAVSALGTSCKMFGKVFSVHMEFIKAPSRQNWKSFKEGHTTTNGAEHEQITVNNKSGAYNEYN